MAQALYRKYRSKTLGELVGQEPVATALTNSLKNGNLSHAYLFTGPRGVGKTSVARILAYEINEIPYNTDELPLDIIEIDAASNRRIDEIRDLRDKVRIAPTSAKYKVYIIDEVHMLTREAFNALLKTLEEPPAHVIFILATTEAHKIPETIVSRTQRYSFKLIEPEAIAAHLKTIAAKEKIDITDDALLLIAKHSGGSLRDALSLLDQIRHTGGKIDETVVQTTIGLPATEHIDALVTAIANGSAKEVLELIKKAADSGISALLVAQALMTELKDQLTSPKPKIDLATSLQLMQELLLVEGSQQPDTALEVALLGAVLAHKGPVPVAKSQTIEAGPPLTLTKPVAEAKRDIAAHEAKIAVKQEKQAKKALAPKPKPALTPDQTTALTNELWQETLNKIKTTHNTLYSVLRMAAVDLDKASDGTLTLNFKFPFHQKRINEARNKQVILDTLHTYGVSGVEILCELQQKLTPEPVTEAVLEPITANDMPKRDDAWLSQVKNVFGGAEVLE